jgi:hypothetical protein
MGFDMRGWHRSAVSITGFGIRHGSGRHDPKALFLALLHELETAQMHFHFHCGWRAKLASGRRQWRQQVRAVGGGGNDGGENGGGGGGS